MRVCSGFSNECVAVRFIQEFPSSNIGLHKFVLTYFLDLWFVSCGGSWQMSDIGSNQAMAAYFHILCNSTFAHLSTLYIATY